MNNIFDWYFAEVASPRVFKFFRTERNIKEDEMMNVVRATALPEHPNRAVLYLDGEMPEEYETVTLRDRVYHLIPFSMIDRIYSEQRSMMEAKRINLFEHIKGVCGEQ